MAQQVINIGTVAGDGTGDSLRESQRKSNENFSEIYTRYAPNLGVVTPTDTPAGTGINYWECIEAGTYTNFGGVVLGANSRGTIFRNLSGVFSISQVAYDVSGKVNVSDVINTLVSTETAKPLSAAQGKVLKEEITKKANLTVGKNLFNKDDSDVQIGYAISAGNGNSNVTAGFTATGFIPVIAGQTIVSNYSSGGYGNAYYDADKVFISGSSSTGVLTIPAGAFFLRKTLATLLVNLVQIELGSVSSTYEAYKLSVPVSELGNAALKSELQPALDLIAKKANLTVGKNLFNYQDADVVLNSVIGGDGNIYGGNSGLIITGFIPVIPAQVIVSNRSSGGWGNNYYDANKVRLSTTTSTSALTIPAGAFYLRKTVFLSGLGLEAAQIQIELGSVSTSFEVYKYKVPFIELNASNTYDLASSNPVNSLAVKDALDLNNLYLGEYKNMFNKDTVTAGKYVYTATGALFDNPDFSASDFIRVVGGLQYYTNGHPLHAYYDTNYAYISGVTTALSTAPINAVYIRISTYSAQLNTTYLTQGSSAINYVPYAYTIKESFLPVNKYANKIANPLKQHFLSTIENNIYLDEFQKRKLQANPLKTEPNIGQVLNNFIRATNPAVGTYTVNNQLMDLDFNVVQEKDFSIQVTNLSKTTPINLLCIGDSYTDIGQYVTEVGSTIPAVNYVGMCKSVSGSDVKREGRAGYTLQQYITDRGVGHNYYFTPFSQPIAPYTYYGNTAFWQVVYDQSGPGYGYLSWVPWVAALNINSSGVRATPSTNDVMYFTADTVYKVWNGSAWTVISEATLNFSINIAKYRSTWSVPMPDVVTVLLGMNDFRHETPTNANILFAQWKTNLNLLISGFKADNASVKFIICTCNSVEDNFRGGEGNAALWEAYNNIITEYDNREAENIFISDTKAAVDRVYGFEGSDQKPFDIFSQTEKIWIGSGNIHLASSGMKQIGKKLAATIQYARP